MWKENIEPKSQKKKDSVQFSSKRFYSQIIKYTRHSLLKRD